MARHRRPRVHGQHTTRGPGYGQKRGHWKEHPKQGGKAGMRSNRQDIIGDSYIDLPPFFSIIFSHSSSSPMAETGFRCNTSSMDGKSSLEGTGPV
mmetsp:Transcript_26489/g.46692  ORF Transcript_26489/g.46692 Transcript_26489/m.46692 type:complete len:95 (-) Transcript_26489:1231-1515(-)